MRKLFFLFLTLTLGIGAWATAVGDQFEDATSRLKFEVTSLDPKTVKVIANDYTGSSFTIPATVSYLEDDYAVTAIGENAFDGVGSQSNPADLLLPVDWEGSKPAASATLWYGGYFVDYRAATIADIKAASDEAENLIEEAATGFVGIEDVIQAKANADSALADAQATADNTIGAAADMDAIAYAKDDAISAIGMATDEALVAIEAAIYNFKANALAVIDYKVANAEATINEAADGYDYVENIREIIDRAKAEFEEEKNKAYYMINEKNDMDEVLQMVEDFIHEIEDRRDEAVEEIQAAIASLLKKYAIDEIELAIVGVTDEDILAIAEKAIEDINDATTAQEIDAVKTLALAKINALVLIQVARQGIQNTEINAMIDDAVTAISSATNTEQIEKNLFDAITVIDSFQSGKEEGKAEALGEMGEPCDNCPIVEVTKGDKTVKLYNPKSVKFKKE